MNTAAILAERDECLDRAAHGALAEDVNRKISRNEEAMTKPKPKPLESSRTPTGGAITYS